MAQTGNSFEMYKAEDVVLNFTIYGSSSTSTPLDVTGFTTAFNFKANPTDTAAIFTLAGVISCATGGKIAVTIASCQTATLAPQEYAHDLWRTDAASLACLSIGNVYLLGSVRTP